MHLSVKLQLTLLISMISLVALSIAFGIVLPAIKSITQLDRDITQTQLFLEQRYRKTQRLRRSANAIENIRETTEKYRRATIEKGGELQIITKLEQLAATNNIDPNVSVRFTSKDEALEQLTDKDNINLGQPYFTFSFLNHGLFVDQIKYLKALEELDEYFIVDGLQWEKRQQTTNTAAPVTLRFDADVYVSVEI